MLNQTVTVKIKSLDTVMSIDIKRSARKAQNQLGRRRRLAWARNETTHARIAHYLATVALNTHAGTTTRVAFNNCSTAK